ncbi:MAG: hypothetical protein ACRDJH_18385 [Thermomicrobiales bacterium]
MAEGPYQFRRRLEVVHTPDRRDPAARPRGDEFAVGEGWSIVVGLPAAPLVLNAAKDLQDYLLVSMGESVLLRRVDDVAAAAATGQRVIVLTTTADLPGAGDDLSEPRSYRIVCSPDRVVVRGADDRGAAQGSYYLEDLMNLREAPFLQPQDVTRAPLFSPRMIHSGWGLDEFPDAHLNAAAHAGIDAILLFVTGADRTPDEHTHQRDSGSGLARGRYQDVNALVDRAAAYGLDVYFYAYFRHLRPPHPAEPDAERSYAQTYGAIFEACPRAKGIVLVGESVEFPSKDPNTTGLMRLDPDPGGLPRAKPNPGWWPCVDYPQWVAMVSKVVRRHNPDADIIFWTYNWGYAPEEDRLALIRSLPTDVTLQVTFEMFEEIAREGVVEVCVDYTASFAGPGRYFASEAQAAHERGLRLYTMCNTGGLTWDFGDIPYEPIPYQWARRHAALRDARQNWGLSGLMESHHFGWWPSFVSDLAKWNYWEPSPSSDEICAALARRDFGEDAAPLALAAWQAWSEAILDYIPTNEDQYGPFRVGPSFPLVFRALPNFPAASHAMFGNRIVRIDYQPQIGGTKIKTAGPARIAFEIRSLERMAERWQDGIAHMAAAVARTPERKRVEAARQLGLARFVLHATRTTIHTKQWWTLKQRLFGEADPALGRELLDQMVAVAERELANAEAALPLVEADSRLGWEPSMEYVGDADHIHWKLAQVRRVIASEIPAYRAALDVTGRAAHAATTA